MIYCKGGKEKHSKGGCVRHTLSPDGVQCVGPQWTNLSQSLRGKRKCQKLKQTLLSEERRIIGQDFSLLGLVIHRFHRIIELLKGFWLEGTLKTISFQPPVTDRDNFY